MPEPYNQGGVIPGEPVKVKIQPGERAITARRYVKDRYGAEGWRAVRYIGPCDEGGKA